MPVCLMHSRDPQKNWEEFWQEIQTILAKHEGEHDFVGFVFTQYANFMGAQFTQVADFSEAQFTQDADFRHAEFTQDADFSEAQFTQAANFSGAQFTQALYFIRTQFGGLVNFSHARFEKPDKVLFNQVNRSSGGLKLQLTGCLLDGVRFEDVRWHRQNGRLILQDELDLHHRSNVTHELVADCYRRLVNNFERSRQFQLAEECIVGEMEMRRRNPRNFLLGGWSRLERFYRKHARARWLGQNFSVLNLYRVFSKYGNSYLRAFCWIVVLALLIFPTLFGLAGLQRKDLLATNSTSTPLISWHNAWSAETRPYELWQTYKTMVLATLETATLQRNPYALPATGAGRATQIVTVLTMPGLLALFLFALRRRFRR